MMRQETKDMLASDPERVARAKAFLNEPLTIEDQIDDLLHGLSFNQAVDVAEILVSKVEQMAVELGLERE